MAKEPLKIVLDTNCLLQILGAKSKLGKTRISVSVWLSKTMTTISLLIVRLYARLISL